MPDGTWLKYIALVIIDVSEMVLYEKHLKHISVAIAQKCVVIASCAKH